jgi:DNA repair protein RecO (recombination protein O)
MDWQDDGVILSLRRHGETSAIVEAFTALHGRHAGVVRGGASRRMTPDLQPGTQVRLTWRARLDEHIGTFTSEVVASRAGLLSDALALAGLNAVTALLSFALPEREPHPGLYAATQELLAGMLSGAGWPADYGRWELCLLEELGYGLDLSACAVTGRSDDLAYVSPKTGSAVSRAGAGEWAPRLLPLPGVLLGRPAEVPGEFLDALRTTGHFLASRLAADLHRPLPAARERLVDSLARSVAAG